MFPADQALMGVSSKELGRQLFVCLGFLTGMSSECKPAVLQEKLSELTEYIDEGRHQWQRVDLFAPTSLAHARQLLAQAQVTRG